jgi:hypothetical protein
VAGETVYKYVISPWTLKAKIDKLRLVKETAQFVTVLDRFEAEDRFKKQGRAFNTWEEAHRELLCRAEVDVANSERRLKSARQTLLEIQAMESGGEKCH